MLTFIDTKLDIAPAAGSFKFMTYSTENIFVTYAAKENLMNILCS